MFLCKVITNFVVTMQENFSQNRITHKKILLVEDDPDDQLFFTEALSHISKEIGYDIASDGMDALK